MDFKRPDPEQLKFWEQASYLYHDQMNQKCLSYLNGRGINTQSVERCRLGYVENPVKGHEQYRGMLVIPYVKKLATVALKFRCIQDHNCKEVGHAKYLSDGNQWLYGTDSLEDGEECDIAEGELDRIIVVQELNRPCVAVPGVDAWKANPHWRVLLGAPLRGFIWADNDTSKQQNYGHNLGKRISRELPRYRMVTLPDDEDVTSTNLKYGSKELFERAGLPIDEKSAA